MQRAPHQTPRPDRKKIVEALDDVANVLFEGRRLCSEFAPIFREFEEEAQRLENRLDAARAILSAAARAA